MNIRTVAISASLCCLLTTVAQSADWGLKSGNPGIKSAGPIAFGPDGILFVGDTKAATIFALGTGDAASQHANVKLQVSELNKQVASLLGADQVTINDLATNPASGNVYLSVTKGKDASATPAIVRINDAGKLSQVDLTAIPHQKVVLPDAPEDKEVTRNGRTMNPRNDAITDLAFAEGKVFVSGTAASTTSSVHQIPFPFADSVTGTTVEMYHGAHGRVENATIRTFIPMTINGEPSLLAGFTCTPLVKFPINTIKPSEKTVGTTVAELGNRNRPLDMIAYHKDGKDFLLLSNNPRGVMKISTDNIGRSEGITEHVKDGGTAGQTFQTIKELEGVVQLDRLNEDNLVIIVQSANGSQDLKTVPLP